MKVISSEDWLLKFNSQNKVLLLNPPIQEIRYAWSKWNQPTNLLLLSSLLKENSGCEVELLDFMLPEESGRIPFKLLNREKRIGKNDFSMNYKIKYYGAPINEISKRLQSIFQEWKPDHIVISTLTSYWYESILTIIPIFKTLVPDVEISLIGPYPVIETNHAKKLKVNYIVNDFISFGNEIPDFNIYFQPITKSLNNGNRLKFGGLKYTPENTVDNLIKQIKVLNGSNIRDLVIFEDNIFKNRSSNLHSLFKEIENENLKANFYGLTGIELDSAEPGIFVDMLQHGFKSFFIEYNTLGSELHLDNYMRMHKELVLNSSKKISSGSLAGFIMIGTPNDKLEEMFKHTLTILEVCGSIIPKPFTPSPHSQDYLEISKNNLDLLSPHVFPLAEKSGITREEYMDFYKHTTFLNEKRMGDSFDFFDNSYTTKSLKNSLSKKVGSLI
jgi:hypothetical protein